MNLRNRAILESFIIFVSVLLVGAISLPIIPAFFDSPPTSCTFLCAKDLVPLFVSPLIASVTGYFLYASLLRKHGLENSGAIVAAIAVFFMSMLSKDLHLVGIAFTIIVGCCPSLFLDRLVAPNQARPATHKK